MSHERTVAQLVAEIEHITGRRIRIRWLPIIGLYLLDEETGVECPLGQDGKWRILLPAEQESVCRKLRLTHLLDLLGLDVPQD